MLHEEMITLEIEQNEALSIVFPLAWSVELLNSFVVLPPMYSSPENYVVLWREACKNASFLLPSCPYILPNRIASIYPGLLKFSISTTQPGNNVCPVEIRCETSNLIREYNLKGLLHQMNQHNVFTHLSEYT